MKLGILVLLSGAVFFYGWIFAMLGIQILSGELEAISFVQYQNIFWGALAIITLMRMIFPTYQSIKNNIPSYFPVSKWATYLVSVLTDFLTPYFYYVVLLLIGIYIFSQGFPFYFFTIAFTVLIGSQFLRRIIQNLIEFRFKPKIYLNGVLLIGLSGFMLTGLVPIFRICCNYFLATGILMLANFYLETHRVERQMNNSTTLNNDQWKYLKLIVRNPKAKNPLLVGILLKIVLFASDLFLFKTKGIHMLDGEFLYWIFASPVVIFTYIFNNTWGFWKPIWLNVELRTGSFSQLIWNNLKLLTIPFMVDMLVTLPFLLILWNKPGFILLFYFTSSVFLISTSFIWSTLTPRKIESTFQMKGSTSLVGIIVSMGAVVLLTTLEINRWFYILIPLYLILSAFAIYLAKLFYNDWKHIMIKKL